MNETAGEGGALYEGIPPWMKRSIWLWIGRRVTVEVITPNYRTGSTRVGNASLEVALIETFERRRRAVEPVTDDFERYGVEALQDGWGEMTVLQFLDYCIAEDLAQGRVTGPRLDDILELDGILEDCNSVWKVGSRDGFPGLERRVPLGVQEAADQAMSTGEAGRRLSEAWHAAYGIKPDPSKAYSLAVKAVEDAAIPKVCPTDRQPTLGKVISTLRRQGDWSLPFAHEDRHVSNGDMLVGMLKSLWAGQADRHGGNPDTTLVITQEAAEAAVMLAVPLVQWFGSGAAARPKPARPNPLDLV